VFFTPREWADSITASQVYKTRPCIDFDNLITS
jgi:hypothetical protein